jgi:quercetin dioxygenase-like cupin family protein
MIMAIKVSMKDLPNDGKYEPGFDTHQGITDKTTGTEYGQMSRVHFPPKSESRMHYHTNADMLFYCLSGKTIFRIGREKKEYVVEPGDFFHVPRGQIHNNINPSETETVEGVAAYFGCSDPYKSGKVIVE